MRHGTAALLSIVVLATCSEPTGPDEFVEPLPVVVSIADEALVLGTVGATRTLTASVMRGAVQLAATLSWWSGNDGAVRVSTTGSAEARSRGAATIFVTSDSGGIDSIRVTVDPVPASLSVDDRSVTVLRGRTRDLAATAFDSSGAIIRAPRLAWTVLDTTIATVSASGRITARAEGSTTVRVSLGALTDSLTVAVAPYPRLRVATDTVILASGSRILDPPAFFADSVPDGQAAQITATVVDTSIAWVVPTFPIPRRADADLRPDFEGRALGTTRVVFSAPGWQDAEVVLRVLPAQLGQTRRRRQPIDFPEWAFIGPTRGGMVSDLADSLGRGIRILAPRLVRFASSDTTVVRLLADTASAVGTEPAIAYFDVLREGTAEVVATTPGVLPETLVVFTRMRGFYFNRFGYELAADTVRVGYRARVTVGSRAFLATNGAQLDVTLTQRRPDLLQLPPAPVTLRWYDPVPKFSYIGLAPGVDTIIAAAPGHATDTLVVRVLPATLPRVVTPDTLGFIQMYTITGTTGEWVGPDPIVLRVTSSDTSVLRSESEFVTVQNTSQYEIRVLRRGVGTAAFTVTDTSGRHPPLQFDPIEVRPSWLHLYVPENPEGGAQLGVRQRRNIGVETHWWAGSDFRATLRSSDTSIVRLSATAASQLPFAVDLESGDVPGTAWIIASGNGFVTDSTRVTVTRGRLDAGPGRNFTAGIISNGFTINVSVRDADGNLRITRDSLFLKVRSTNRNRLFLLDSIVVIPAGGSFSGPIGYNTFQVGPVGVTVHAMQPLRPYVDAGSTGFVIVPLPAVQLRKD